MANRHLSRSVAMQALFEWDFGGCNDSRIESILERDMNEFAPGLDDGGFARSLIEGVLKKNKKLDGIIEKAAPEWPLAQIAIVDRNVLRIGLFELLFGDHKEVPPKVAINEAIELAKSFGGDSSGRFVNGVLGTVYREMGEPGKDDTGKKKKVADPSKLPVEALGGAVVYRKDAAGVWFVFVHDVFGYWTLSKGHLEEGDTVESGTLRELREEIGVENLSVKKELGVNEYIASDPQKGPVRRRVTYFLVETPDTELKLGTSGGLDDVRWFRPGETAELKMYDDIRPLVERALAEIT
ncbi:MAG: transcription antitermination factor NusB [Candidatus Niyogibacteria bacterium]|nr:transcription antitermination factor NusB [Candidatus Niyogibacteria bacterium]